MSATEDRIRRRRERLERLGKIAPVTSIPQNLRLWLGDPLQPAHEHGDGPGLDIIAILSGKFLVDTAPVPTIPEHEHIRMFTHLDTVPAQMPRMPTLVDAPPNPTPEPQREPESEPSPNPLRPKGIELDEDAVIVSLNEHRKRTREPTVKDEVRASIDRVKRKYGSGL